MFVLERYASFFFDVIRDNEVNDPVEGGAGVLLKLVKVNFLPDPRGAGLHLAFQFPSHNLLLSVT